MISSQLFSPLVPGMTGYAIIAGIVAALIVVLKFAKCSKLDAIPTVGSNSWLGSWWAGLMYLSHGMDFVLEGYEKHKSMPFKIANLDHWIVVVSSQKHVDELWRAPDDTLSSLEFIHDLIQVTHTMGPEIIHNPYHLLILRSRLTRNIGALYPEIRNEIIMAFDDVLNLHGNDWKSVPALDTVRNIVCRTSNRVFVGLPLCHDLEWINLNIQHTLHVFTGAAVIRQFPESLKSIVTRFFTRVEQDKQRGRKLLGPIIRERQKYLTEHGNQWACKPDDFLSWLMEEAEGPESTVEFLTNRILAINVAAIHTTAQAFTHVLFYLAANPQYIQPLREEVEKVIEKDGWTKASLAEMRKVDSFLKECQRFEGDGGVGVTRVALKDFTFTDGTFIPKGTTVTAASWCIHHNEAFYKNANSFEPFRFADLREEGNEGAKHQFVSTTLEYLPFGLGRHACPGRFFASNEMKSMLAHIVVTYDIKLEDGMSLPPTKLFGTSRVPHPSAKVTFRRRVN